MHSLKRASLISALLATMALTSQPASALQPTIDPTAAPRRARAISDAEQRLTAAVPPANDEFANAEIVGSLPFATTLTTLEATTAPDDPPCFGNSASVWYAYTPPISTTLAADTFGSDYDTTLAAYTGAQGSLTELACNDDAGAGLQSQIVIPVVGGQTYYFMAAGVFAGGSLAFDLDGAAFPQIGVRTTRAIEARPSADAHHLAWSQMARTGSGFAALYMQEPGRSRVRVNRRRTHGFSGGFEGDSLVYQEVRRTQSDLRLFDLVGGGRSSPPAGVNTRGWEWHPTLSGDWLLFGRRNFRTKTDRALLRNLVTGESIALDRLGRAGSRRFVEAGQVSGDYAVWYRCTPACDVFRYDIAARTTTRIPNPNRRQQYDPSVTSDGTVYFLRSGRGCGASVTLVRQPLTGPSRVLASLGAGRDSAHTYALENADGTTSVVFDRVRCSTSAWDVLKVVDP